jgi:hypothetical protein
VKKLVSCTEGRAQRLRVFENKMLRRIFGSKGEEEVMGERKRVHNAVSLVFTKYHYDDQIKVD